MPLSILRQIAFEGDLRSWILDPPSALLPPFQATGLHLRFDALFLARITELVFERGLNIGPALPFPELLQTKRQARRRACWDAINRFGSNRDYYLETLIGWAGRCIEMGYPQRAKPVIVIIDYDPKVESILLSNLPHEYKGYPIHYRPSPAAEAHFGSGSRIGNGGANFGTLGGFMLDSITQDLYALTCAHVAGQANTLIGQVDNHGKMLNSIGTVVDSIMPATGGPCNARARPGAGVDAALIKLSQTGQPSLPSSLTVAPIDDIDEEDPIVFEGSKSGRVNARVAFATVWKSIKIGDRNYCFGDLFTLGHTQPAYVLQAVSQPGDSGAWIFEDGRSASINWLGMVIAGDRQHNQSLACHAEHVFAWVRSKSANLVLPL